MQQMARACDCTQWLEQLLRHMDAASRPSRDGGGRLRARLGEQNEFGGTRALIVRPDDDGPRRKRAEVVTAEQDAIP